MKEALKTARFLVRLSKKKKEEDSQVLEKSLKRDLAESDPQPEALQSIQVKAETIVPQQQQQRQAQLQQQQQQVQQLNPQAPQQPLQQPQIPGPMMDDQQQISWEQGPLTTSSGEDWNMDYLNNTEFDWNFFLSQDIPAFQNLAPDGMM
jgi:DNA primase